MLIKELPRYKSVVEYTAQFVYMRQSMGDMDAEEIMKEFTENVTRVLKEVALGGPPAVGDDGVARPN